MGTNIFGIWFYPANSGATHILCVMKHLKKSKEFKGGHVKERVGVWKIAKDLELKNGTLQILARKCVERV